MSAPLHLWTVDRLLVCVPADVAASTGDALRRALDGDPTADAVLDVLTAGGLSSTPSFLCVVAEPVGDAVAVRVVVRGELSATAVGRDGTEVALRSGRSATWNDDVVTDVARVVVPLGDGNTYEWLAPTAVGSAPTTATPPATTPPPAPVLPAPAPPPTREPEPQPEPEPEPEPDAAPATLDGAGFARAVGEDDGPAGDAPSGDALDFSALLEDTGARPSAPPPPPAPPHQPPPPPPAPSPPPTPPAPASPPADPPTISRVPPPGPAPAPAPATQAPAPQANPEVDLTGLGDHDGRTMTLADLRRLQEERGATTDATPATEPVAPRRAGEVRARRCPQGHPNPPTAAQCRQCDATLDAAVEIIPRPTVVRLVFDSGLVVEVDRPQLIGRRPTTPEDPHPDDEIPNLVTVPSPESDISRVHTAVQLAGWDVLVADAGSTNGTEVRLPGQEPIRLREHDPVLVVPGTEVTMAGAIRFRVESVRP